MEKMAKEEKTDDAPLSQVDELQRRIGQIANEAKKRNPNGYCLTPPRQVPRRGTPQKENVFAPFVTESGQHIMFFNDAVNVPAKRLAD